MSKPIKLENGMEAESAKVWSTNVSFGKDRERFVAVTDWINGEGFDVEIEGKSLMTLTIDEADAIMNALRIALERGCEE